MKPKIDYVTLYTSALCNLKCDYCYICKNQGLEIIDKELEQCYADTNYFFNLYKDLVGNEGLNDLETIHLMGGEPLLNAQRIIPALEVFVKNCNRLGRILIYSNFAHNNIKEPIKMLTEMLAKYPQRHFKVEFQISIDGPADINDEQRGKGVTDRIIANLKDLIKEDAYWKPNLTICIHPKSTISPKQIDKFLDIDYVINYYKFFEENFYDIVKESKNPEVQLDNLNIPVIASPWNATKEDGQKLTKILENFNLVDKLNLEQSIFKYHKDTINWYFTRPLIELLNNDNTYSLNVPYCPFGISRIGLLPGNKYTGCQRAFTDYCETYLDNYQIDLINKDDFLSAKTAKDFIYKDKGAVYLFNAKIARLNEQNFDKTAYVDYNLNLIKLLAQIEQIDSKYIDDKEAFKALQMIHAIQSACAYNNIIASGNELLNPTANYKLFLNGALDVLLECNKIYKDKYKQLQTQKVEKENLNDTYRRKQ